MSQNLHRQPQCQQAGCARSTTTRPQSGLFSGCQRIRVCRQVWRIPDSFV